MSEFPITFVEIDLSQTTKHGGAGLEVGPLYLCLIDGQYFTGQFGEQWYGLYFWGKYNGYQYDPPGTNATNWQKIWRMDGAKDFANGLEEGFARTRRSECAKKGLEINGLKITEETPLEAFYYRPDYSKCRMSRWFAEEAGIDDDDPRIIGNKGDR